VADRARRIRIFPLSHSVNAAPKLIIRNSFSALTPARCAFVTQVEIARDLLRLFRVSSPHVGWRVQLTQQELSASGVGALERNHFALIGWLTIALAAQ
jgi:hypothetical protein